MSSSTKQAKFRAAVLAALDQGVNEMAEMTLMARARDIFYEMCIDDFGIAMPLVRDLELALKGTKWERKE